MRENQPVEEAGRACASAGHEGREPSQGPPQRQAKWFALTLVSDGKQPRMLTFVHFLL